MCLPDASQKVGWDQEKLLAGAHCFIGGPARETANPRRAEQEAYPRRHAKFRVEPATERDIAMPVTFGPSTNLDHASMDSSTSTSTGTRIEAAIVMEQWDTAFGASRRSSGN